MVDANLISGRQQDSGKAAADLVTRALGQSDLGEPDRRLACLRHGIGKGCPVGPEP